MTDQVKALEPPGDQRGASSNPVPSSEPRPPAPMLMLVFLVGVIGAVTLGLSPGAGTDLGIEPSDAIRPALVSPDFDATAVDPDRGIGDDAIATVRQLNRSINLGDSASVMELLAPIAPRRSEFRRAEWPLLPTDASWWDAGHIDPSAVEGSVRYLFTIPGSVFLSECDAQPSPPVMGGTLVTCDYTASGGALKALGQQPESGHLHVMLVDGVVAGVERHGTTDRALWTRFARWTLDNDSDAFFTHLGSTEGRLLIDPPYSGDAALVHVELAEAMASLE